MTQHDLDLLPPEEEPAERTCGTCRRFEPCPCGCCWGVCHAFKGGELVQRYTRQCDEWGEA